VVRVKAHNGILIVRIFWVSNLTPAGEKKNDGKKRVPHQPQGSSRDDLNNILAGYEARQKRDNEETQNQNDESED